MHLTSESDVSVSPFLSLESVEKSLSKKKLQRETKELVSPFKVDLAGQIEHGFSTSPIAVFGRYS